jgi:hypothetical protein
MNMLAVPTIPEGLYYMVDPPGGRIRGVTLLKKLVHCSFTHEKCQVCTVKKTCEFYYDFLIETGAVANWKGANRNVTRFYQ